MRIIKKDTGNLFITILAIIFVIYNLCVIVIGGFGHSVSYNLSWIFMNFSMFIVATVLYFLNRKMWKDYFFNYPIFKHSCFYLILEFVLSVIFMICSLVIVWEVVFIIQLVVLSVYIIFAISSSAAVYKINELKSESSGVTMYIKLLKVDVDLIAEKCENNELKEKFMAFSDNIRHSDYFTHPALTEIEKKIKEKVTECDAAIVNGDVDTAEKTLAEAKLLLSERNKKCMALRS